MHRIERYIERLLDLSSSNVPITSAVVFVAGIGLIWVVSNGWGK